MDPYREQPALDVRPATPVPSIPGRRARLVRALGLWATVIVLLVLMMQLTDWRAPVELLVGATMLGVSVGVLFYRRRLVRLLHENNDAVALLTAGRVDDAVLAFDTLASRARPWPRYLALFTANAGIARMRRGELDDALVRLQRAHESGWIKPTDRDPTGLTLQVATAIAYVCKGDLDEARRWQERAHASAVPARRGVLVVMDALVAAKQKDWTQVDAVCEAGWSSAEGAQGAFQMRLLRLVRAFALTESLAAATRDGVSVTSLLEGARPSQRGEFGYLVGAWPEFRAFLVEHRFDG